MQPLKFPLSSCCQNTGILFLFFKPHSRLSYLLLATTFLFLMTWWRISLNSEDLFTFIFIAFIKEDNFSNVNSSMTDAHPNTYVFIYSSIHSLSKIKLSI